MADLDRKLEIYKVLVSTITANENRRQQASVVYLGMIAAIVTAVGVVRYNIQLIYPASLIFLISTVWFLTIRYFRRLAKAKFAVVSEIEKDLPVAAFEMEWKMLSEEKKNSIDLTHLEMFLPLFIALGCVVYIVFELLKAR